MILKIERYPGSRATEQFMAESIIYQDWWMLDDIRKISKAQFKHPFSQDFEDRVDADIFIMDYEEYLHSLDAGQDSRTVIRLICRLANGNEFCILFDTTAYVLNDNGKTIEKIVANHR